MRDRLTETQVARVVAEVSRQAQLRELDERERLDRDQVVRILEELNLPVELLDPAMRELERHEAEAAEAARYERAVREQRRRRLVVAGSVVAVLLVLVLLAGLYVQRRGRALAAVEAVGPGRITRSSDDGGSLGAVSRDGTELFYRVTLGGVPIDENLRLKCNWVDPEGRVVRQNSWETRATDKSVWATSCRHNVGAAARPGAWTVEMLLGDRVVSRTAFRVE
ncbi:MAG TPA: hypothetical protein VEY09_15860 [Pyrinomonadaceae bacterium]|nr:hypothetical protein [Pyrinomonadaceae bacterium]